MQKMKNEQIKSNKCHKEKDEYYYLPTDVFGKDGMHLLNMNFIWIKKQRLST
jgi:hypothetical protein